MTKTLEYSIELTGDVGLRDAPALADQLRGALQSHDDIIIDADGLTGMDASILQVLIAARKTALADGKSLAFSAPADGVLRQLLRKAGVIDAGGHALTPEGVF